MTATRPRSSAAPPNPPSVSGPDGAFALDGVGEELRSVRVTAEGGLELYGSSLHRSIVVDEDDVQWVRADGDGGAP